MSSRVYKLSASCQLRDLCVSSFRLFAHKGTSKNNTTHLEQRVKASLFEMKKLADKMNDKCNVEIENILEKIQREGKFDLSLTYPIMNPQQKNLEKLMAARASHIKITESIVMLQAEMTKKKPGFGKKKMEEYKVISGLLLGEIVNRTAMHNLLLKLTMPNSFNEFLNVLDSLSVDEKRTLIRLVTKKERLSAKHKAEKAPFEIMFAYDSERRDFTVGIRSAYDYEHPHPTLIGGVDPQTIAAGTIDLALKNDAIKISKIRIDSGHFRPEAETLEVILGYIKHSLNPKFFDHLILHTFEDDAKAPEIVIDAPMASLR